MVHAIPAVPSIFIAVFFLAMSGVAIAASLHAQKVAAAIDTTPLAQVASAPVGRASFEGRVAAINGQTITSPFTGSPCCWFHVKVEKYSVGHYRNDMSGQGSWHALAEHTSCEPFLLADGGGSGAVFPDGAEVTPTDRSVWYGATPLPEDRNPKRVGPGESAEGMLRVEGTPNRRYRYTEERIYDGDPLYVIGTLERGPDEDEDDDFDPNGASFTKARATNDDLTAFEDGRWVGTSRFVEFRTAAAKLTPVRIVANGSGRNPFIVSTTLRDKLLRVNRGGSSAGVGVAVVPAAIALFFLWLRFVR
jgi:hypothetical protein